MTPVIEPADLRDYVHLMEGTEYQDIYIRLLKFCEQHKQHYNSPTVEVPASWSGVILNGLARMVALEPSIKIGKIVNEDSKLRIYHSYCARNREKIDSMKNNMYNAIDRLILKKIGSSLGNKTGVVL